MAACHRRETHFALEKTVGGKVWCAVACVSEDCAAIRCWTTLPIGMTRRWLHSPINPKVKKVQLNVAGSHHSCSQGPGSGTSPREAYKMKNRNPSLMSAACNGKWALVCGWSAVSGDFRSQMRVAWPCSGFTITETNTEQVWINVIHPNQLPGWRPDRSICTYILPPLPPANPDATTTWNAFSSWKSYKSVSALFK